MNLLEVAVAAAFGLTIWVLVMRAAYHRGFGAGLFAGYGYGETDGYRHGRSEAALDHILATPTETEHYAGVIGWAGDAAQDSSLAFAEALLSGRLREPVGEDVQR
jgi:hypothetical protein